MKKHPHNDLHLMIKRDNPIDLQANTQTVSSEQNVTDFNALVTTQTTLATVWKTP